MGVCRQDVSSLASATNFEIFLMQRPQHCRLSLSSRASASFMGQVTPACPSSRTSDSLIPLQMQMNIKNPLLNEFPFENDNRYQSKNILLTIWVHVKIWVYGIRH
jgi:hypothetical protein